MISSTGAYLINSLSTFLALTALGGFAIGVYLYQFKKTPGTHFLALMQFFAALWALFYCLEYSATDLALKFFWSKLSYSGILFTPIWFYLFSRRFVWSDKEVSMKLRISLILIALFFICIVLTNDIHHLHWVSASIDYENNTTIYQYGPSFWLVFIFIYGLLTLSILNIMKLISKESGKRFDSVWLIILSCFIPVSGNIMYVFKVNPIPGFDWTPVGFLISGTILAYINIRYGTFDLVLFARNKLIDIMEDAVLLTDSNQTIVDVNQAMLKTLNTKLNMIIGKTLSDIFPSRLELISKISGSTKKLQFEISTDIRPTETHFDMQVSPLFDKKGQFSGHLFVFRDITQRKIYEAKLLAANKELQAEIVENEKLIGDLNAFAHTVAHDLRDTIGAIVSSTDLIEYDLDLKDYDTLRATNHIIYLSATKSLHVLKELLTMATIRQEDIKTEPVDMGKVVDEAINRLSENIKESQATILKPEKWPVINSYSSWLEEVWVNYLSNAIKYGGSPPVIEIGADQFYSENKVRFWVKDNGRGLRPIEQEKLFIKFTRLHTTRVQGTGLGLSIVKRIVEKLGGEVGIFSNAIPGEGCLFYFTLPEKQLNNEQEHENYSS